jgi:hypothetical protein
MNLVCFIEEKSAREMLEGILPRLFPESVYVQYIVFEGKQDLRKNTLKRLRYWNTPDSTFLADA